MAQKTFTQHEVFMLLSGIQKELIQLREESRNKTSEMQTADFKYILETGRWDGLVDAGSVIDKYMEELIKYD